MTWVLPIVLIVLLFAALLLAPVGENHEAEHSIGWHHAYGTHRVLYPDGQRSQPFSYKTARDYAEIFGGKVILR